MRPTASKKGKEIRLTAKTLSDFNHNHHPLNAMAGNRGGASSAGVLRFYTDEAPGLRV